jgi:hypothetical protein
MDRYLNSYSVGLQNVGSYQVSGQPFLTGSETKPGQEYKISFPRVTKSVTVVMSGTAGSVTAPDALRVSFASTASMEIIQYSRNYFTLGGEGDAVTFNVKCKEIFINCITTQGEGAAPIVGFEIIAELTNIPTGSMYALTGTGIAGGSN